jgi:hypothetical protein
VHPDGSEALQGAWRLFFSFTHSLSPPAGMDNQALDDRRTWRMLEERQSSEEPLPQRSRLGE